MGTLYLRLKLDEEYNPKLLDYPVTQRREIKEVYRKREKKAARHCLIALATLSFFLGTILVVYFVLHARQARIAGGGPVL
ncbi:hypothetical protein FRB97_007109 [Tulasnella sp. 331]|nr:hypothetical protein FRB97_007109 [Tulasnella sp. 331]